MAGEQGIELLLRQRDQMLQILRRAGKALELVGGSTRCRPAAARQRQDGACSPFSAVEFEQHRLDRADRRRRQRQRRGSRGRQRQRADRLRGEFAAQRHRLAVLAAPCRRSSLSARSTGADSGSKRSDDPRIAAVGGIEELHQVVGADREEIDALEQFVELEQQRRHFQHGADLDALRQRVAVPAQMRQLHARPAPWPCRTPRPWRSSGT